MGECKAIVRQVGIGAGYKFLITLSGPYNELEEAKAFADGIYRAKAKMKGADDWEEKFIPFLYEVDPETDKVHLRSLLMVFT